MFNLKSNWKKITIISIISMLILIGGVILANEEIRLYLLSEISPSTFKRRVFVKLTNDDQDIYILGTIHDRHLTTNEYSLLHIKAVIKNLKPDLLLVESRPTQLEHDNIGDGPIEMPFANLTARSLNISVAGMDWWSINMEEKTNNRRDDKMVSNILKEVPGYKKVLILTGFSHVGEFVPRLNEVGYKVVEFSDDRKKKLFSGIEEKLTFPTGMKHYIEKRIIIDKKTLESINDKKWKEKYQNVIKNRENVLKIINMVGEN
ncbi:MAG: hypothetical protein ACOCRO_09280 [Halanaerobiales bacterium]